MTAFGIVRYIKDRSVSVERIQHVCSTAQCDFHLPDCVCVLRLAPKLTVHEKYEQQSADCQKNHGPGERGAGEKGAGRGVT